MRSQARGLESTSAIPGDQPRTPGRGDSSPSRHAAEREDDRASVEDLRKRKATLKRAILRKKILLEQQASNPEKKCGLPAGKRRPSAECFETKRKKRAILRKKMRLEQQALQPQGTSYWKEHKGQSQTRPTERVYPVGFKGQMYPAGAAANHPAAATLQQWATKGCPVDTGLP